MQNHGACDESTWDHHRGRFPLRWPQIIVTAKSAKARAANEGQAKNAPAPAHQFLRACAVEMHFEDFKVNECTVDSNDLPVESAGHLQSDTRP